jgi:putative Mg2+ transporter-C (MgtC) family protein
MSYDIEIIFRLLLASLLGGLIGLEREVHGREAGIRTYLLVSLGSALIMVISESLFIRYQVKFPGENLRLDPGRIAAQAITGIGFLGAGVIIRYRDSIRGLTTAACMWVVCAIGLSIGSGYYLFGSVVTGITVLSLLGLKGVGKRMSKDWYKELIIISGEIDGQFDRIQQIMRKYHIAITNFGIKKDLQKNELTLNFRLRIRTVELNGNILEEILTLSNIKSVEFR